MASEALRCLDALDSPIFVYTSSDSQNNGKNKYHRLLLDRRAGITTAKMMNARKFLGAYHRKLRYAGEEPYYGIKRHSLDTCISWQARTRPPGLFVNHRERFVASRRVVSPPPPPPPPQCNSCTPGAPSPPQSIASPHTNKLSFSCLVRDKLLQVSTGFHSRFPQLPLVGGPPWHRFRCTSLSASICRLHSRHSAATVLNGAPPGR